MIPFIRWLRTMAVGGVVLATSTNAFAQFNPNYRGTLAPTNQTQGVSTATVPFAPGFVPSPPTYNNGYGYGGGGFFGGGFIPFMDPAGGYLNGVANVTNANAQYQLTIQQARLQKESVNAAQIENRRRRIDEWRYEKEITPTPEELREADRQMALQRARNTPPNTEIWSGSALNTMLIEIQQQHARGIPGPTVSLDDSILSHIRYTDGTTPGSGIGAMQQDKLQWPLVLKSEKFKKERDQIDQFSAEAMRQAAGSGVQFETLTALNASIKSLQDKVVAGVNDLTPTEFIQARRFAGELQDAAKALQNPQVKKYVDGSWQPRADSVGGLVKEMTSKGLRFAPATATDNASYSALYFAMLAYDNGLTQLTAGNRQPSRAMPR